MFFPLLLKQKKRLIIWTIAYLRRSTWPSFLPIFHVAEDQQKEREDYVRDSIALIHIFSSPLKAEEEIDNLDNCLPTQIHLAFISSCSEKTNRRKEKIM